MSSARRHYQLALAAHRRDRFADAQRHYREVHRLFPEHPGALHGLGLVALHDSRYAEAVGYLQRACNAAPGNHAIRCNLGHALLNAGRYEEALSCFRAVLRHQPENIHALTGAGDALNILGRTEEAARMFGRILKIEPENAAGHFGLSGALMQLGETVKARTALERAVAAAPRRVSFHRALAETDRFREGDARLPPLEALAREQQTLPDDQKAELHFALAKAYDDLDRRDEAFAHWEAGNSLKRSMVKYDEQAVADIFLEMKHVFTREYLQHGTGDASAVPIFIVGIPRSGTTLIEQILASGDSVIGAGELTYVQDLIREGYGGAEYPRDSAGLTDKDLARLGKEYVRRLGNLSPGKSHIVDKFPGNFQHIGLIHAALPNARIVHVHRHPMDTCFSCYSKLFLNGLNYTYDLGELGRYYRMYEALMAHWRSILPGDAMLDVQYETLVNDFENEARRIATYCGLEWSERFLSFHKTCRAVRTFSQSQVRQPLFTTSIGRWRRYEKHLSPLRDALDQTG